MAGAGGADGGPGGSGGAAGGGGALDPPAGASSGGSGGAASSGGAKKTAGGVSYYLVAPAAGKKTPCMIVFSGTEGGAAMSMNLVYLGPSAGIGSYVIGVLDGVTYGLDGKAGADVLDDLRKKYDCDNDRTYLMGESAGTSAALALGFQIRQSHFAAYWANDVSPGAPIPKPKQSASELGFAPYGNAGPGGDFPDAKTIVGYMKAAGYRTPPPAPYDGPGAGSHGDMTQFVAALKWFPGKTRQ